MKVVYGYDIEPSELRDSIEDALIARDDGIAENAEETAQRIAKAFGSLVEMLVASRRITLAEAASVMGTTIEEAANGR